MPRTGCAATVGASLMLGRILRSSRRSVSPHHCRNLLPLMMAELREGLKTLSYGIRRDLEPQFCLPATSRHLPLYLPQVPRRRHHPLLDSARIAVRLSSLEIGCQRTSSLFLLPRRDCAFLTARKWSPSSAAWS